MRAYVQIQHLHLKIKLVWSHTIIPDQWEDVNRRITMACWLLVLLQVQLETIYQGKKQRVTGIGHPCKHVQIHHTHVCTRESTHTQNIHNHTTKTLLFKEKKECSVTPMTKQSN